ncbi:uracil-xanthine permease family protein [Atopococcus tabaci]|uniref:uracil-xanthine permease family protein n=1 Tax=Atopococcus tabaci TaxID=269774 RepID=UPI002409A84C|nr:nucleobase:cation symporter-2 family protein [Atopococcus tabaci]
METRLDEHVVEVTESYTEQTADTELYYGVEDTPDLVTTTVLGFQNVITAFGGLVAVPLIIAGMAGFGIADTAYMVSAALLVSGIVSIIQSKGFGPKFFRVGAGMPTIMGTDFAFVGPAASVIAHGGIAAYFGGTMLASLVELVMSYFIKPVMKFFPPVVTGSVISLMGMTLMSVAMEWAAGGVGAADFGAARNIFIAALIFVIIAAINHYGGKKFAPYSVLIGAVIGYIICIPLGMVDFQQVNDAAWFALPQLFKYGITFRWEYALPFVTGYLVTIIETVGVMQTLGQVTKTDLTDEDIAAGVRADGIGSIIGPIFGSGPSATFSQNAGLIPMTKNASRKVAIAAGFIMIAMSLLPKFATLVSIMPMPVLGGAGLLMFGNVAAAGIQSLSRVKFTNRNMLIVAGSMAVGLGVAFRPEVTAGLPGFLSGLFSSGISAGTIVALTLNILLKEKNETVAE